MSHIFLSHSSKDNFWAIVLADWLRSEGWDDLFLDLDPERGIVADERWERALHQAANRCDALEALARRALIPWLTGIDAEMLAPPAPRGATVGNAAGSPAVDRHMIEQRLLTTDRNDEGQVTVEPAHEALLRQWGLLKGWLEEDLAALAALEASQRATRDWLANDKAKDWLNHSAGRLEEAEAVAAREDLNGFLANDEHDYLRRCRKAHDARTQKELENAKALALAQARAAAHTRVGMVVALVLATGASVVGWQAYRQTEIVEVERGRAEQQAEIAERKSEEANHNLGFALIAKADALAAENADQAALHHRLEAHYARRRGQGTMPVIPARGNPVRAAIRRSRI